MVTLYFQTKVINLVFSVKEGPAGLQKALRRICQESEDAANNGYQLIIFTDRHADKNWVPVRYVGCGFHVSIVFA